MAEPLLIQRLNTQMRYLSQRQTLLARNIANIDTPGFQAHDLKKLDFRQISAALNHRIEMAQTSPSHQPPPFRDTGLFRSDKQRETFEKKPVGNNIVLEEQMGKLSDVGAQHQLSSTLLKKYHQLYRTAVDSKQGA